MAGKTFRGVGDDGEPSPLRPQDDAPRLVDEVEDARGLYSGPTVVDDQKVAEVLKKLRSLDQAPGPLTGVTQAVDDANPTEPVRIDPRNLKIDTGLRFSNSPAPAPAVQSGPPPGAPPPGGPAPGIKRAPGSVRLEDIMYPLARPTAVGRSVSEPADAQPVTIPAEAGRGTMLGRSIHLRDANTPDAAEVEISSGAVQFLDESAPTSQPFPPAEPRVAAVAPASAPKPAVPLPELASPPVHRFHTPFEPTDTQVIGSRKAARALALVAGLAIVGGGWYGWQRFGGTSGAQSPPQAAAPATAPSAPAIEPLAPPPATPASAAAAPAPEPAPNAAPPPAPTAAPPPAPTAATAENPQPGHGQPARPTNRASTSRRSGPAAERRPAARAADPSDDTAAPATRKHGRSPRRPPVTEDPDATLPPSD